VPTFAAAICSADSSTNTRPPEFANPTGYLRIVGELQGLGISVSATSVRAILVRHGLPPAPQRDQLSWRNFLRQHAATTLACDFFTVETAWLKRIYVLFFISLQSRRIEFVARTPNPTGAWVAQQARNLLMTWMIASGRSASSSTTVTRSSAAASIRSS
jgi:hypothetical protein